MAKRPLWIIAVLLLGAAAALWGATGLSWGTASEKELFGAGAGTPDLSVVALLALAALAGVFAVSGWLRRLLGAVVVVVGGWVGWRAVDTAGDFDLLTGRGLALLAALLLAAAGVSIIVYAAALPAMGARYERGDGKRRSGEPGKDMWDGLSEGDDPTVDGPRT
jgi:hypothetical protein